MTRTRRELLAACGAGMTALAGCSALGLGDDRPAYDQARLEELAAKEVPRPPAVFPVGVPDAMRERHRNRARALLDRVPTNPDVPNEVVARQLQHERQHVHERLAGTGEDRENRERRPLGRLSETRYIRTEAARVEAAYRAATNDIAADEVGDRRARLRTGLLAFERDWTYRGGTPADAVVLHRTLERLRREVQQGTTPERAFPREPATAPFRVGDLVGTLEGGSAALGDAERLRARYREVTDDPRSFRTAFSVAASLLERRRESRSRQLHGYLDPEPGEFPFRRQVEDTPAGRLYRRAASSVEDHGAAAGRAARRGDVAAALVQWGTSLAAIRALDTVVADVRNERIGTPGSVGDVTAARSKAVDALGAAWSTDPTAVAVALAVPATERLDAADYALGDRDGGGDAVPDATDVQRAYVYFLHAARHAAAVPETVADVREALDAGVQ